MPISDLLFLFLLKKPQVSGLAAFISLRSKKTTRRKNKQGRSIDRTNEANAFFLPIGEMADLDRVRQSLNQKGFDFQTPAEVIAALDSSISYNKPVYGTHSTGDVSFSLGKISDIFNNTALESTPAEFTYENSDRLNNRDAETLAGIADQLGGTPQSVYSPALRAVTRDFSEATGIAVEAFRLPEHSDSGRNTGFVSPDNPGVIFINADASVPLGNLLAHEWLHSLSHDSAKRSMREVFLREAAAFLDPDKVQIYNLEMLDRYGLEEIRAEFTGNLFSDAILPTPYFQTELLAVDPNKIKELALNLWESANPVAPSSLKDSPDSSLALSEKGLVRLEEAIAKKLTEGPKERAEFYEAIRNRLASLTLQLRDLEAGIGPFARGEVDEVKAERRRIQDAIAEAKAIIGALPIEARGRVNFDFTDITSHTTERGRVNALIRLIGKADEVLETVLTTQYFEAFEKLLDLAKPDLRQNKSIRDLRTDSSDGMKEPRIFSGNQLPKAT
ncbi:MAG: hypothetical protein QM680_13365 [Luteolibacter sp.]